MKATACRREKEGKRVQDMRDPVSVALKIVLSIMCCIFSILTLFCYSGMAASHHCNIDLPGSRRHDGVPKKGGISPEQLQSGKGVGTIEWSEVTGGPKNITGALTPASQDDPETIALRFFEEKKILYGIDDPYRDLYKIQSFGADPWTGYTTIQYGQMYKGVPVENTLIVDVSSRGVISSIFGVYYTDIDVDVNPVVSAEEAKEIALQHELRPGCSPFPADMPPSAFLPDLFKKPADHEFLKSVEPELLIWPAASKDYLLWHFNLKLYSYYIDAHDGVIRGANIMICFDPITPILEWEDEDDDNTTGPNIEVAPATLDFGERPVNQGCSSQEITISNTGSGDLTITDTYLDESPFALTEFTRSFPFVIAPEESLTLKICFSPTDSGDFEGTMAIASNDPDCPKVEITLKGKGTIPALNIQESPGPLYYSFAYYPFGSYMLWSNLLLPYTDMNTEVTTSNTIAQGNFYLNGDKPLPCNFFALSPPESYYAYQVKSLYSVPSYCSPFYYSLSL